MYMFIYVNLYLYFWYPSFQRLKMYIPITRKIAKFYLFHVEEDTGKEVVYEGCCSQALLRYTGYKISFLFDLTVEKMKE